MKLRDNFLIRKYVSAYIGSPLLLLKVLVCSEYMSCEAYQLLSTSLSASSGGVLFSLILWLF